MTVNVVFFAYPGFRFYYTVLYLYSLWKVQAWYRPFLSMVGGFRFLCWASVLSGFNGTIPRRVVQYNMEENVWVHEEKAMLVQQALLVRHARPAGRPVQVLLVVQVLVLLGSIALFALLSARRP